MVAMTSPGGETLDVPTEAGRRSLEALGWSTEAVAAESEVAPEPKAARRPRRPKE